MRRQLWDDLGADLRYAFRSLLREPGFVLVVILTLGLGLGATITIFSAIDAVLLRPLPYPQQEQLVELRQYSMPRPAARTDVAPANFVDWRERAADVLSMAAAEPYSRTYLEPEGPGRVPTWLVTEGFFDILGIPPLLGRTFTRDEFTSGRDRVLVLGYGVWSREFGTPARRRTHGHHGIAPLDPVSYAAAAAIVVSVAAVACGLPALRAVRTDVLTVLRAE